MSNITIYDFEHICRTCLSREDLKPLYENCHADMLMTCTNVKFVENDGLPMKICANCISEIDQAFSFAKRCETIDTILRKCIPNIKIELDDNSFQTIGTEEDIIIKEEIILPSSAVAVKHDEEVNIKLKPTVEEVVENFEYVEVEQCVEVKQEEHDEIYEDPANESSEEDDDDQDETYSENSDDQKEEESSKNLGRKGKIPARSTDFKCTECDREFKSKKLLLQHSAIHGEKKFICEVCGKGYALKGRLNAHAKKHSGYVCNVCGEESKSLTNFKKHRLIHTDGRHVCSVCNKSFAESAQLKYHMGFHTGDHPYTCKVCNKICAHSSALKVHLKMHTGVKPYTCEFCNKTFYDASSLRRHKRIHTGEKPYSCEVCSRTFTHSASLLYHKRVHTGEKPYTCEVCNKKSKDCSTHRYHMRIHTGEMPYTCEVCSKKFTHSATLKNHKRMHTGERPFNCKVCSKTFINASGLSHHMKHHTGV